MKNINCRCGLTGGCDNCSIQSWITQSVIDINKELDGDLDTQHTPEVEEIVEEFKMRFIDTQKNIADGIAYYEWSDIYNAGEGIHWLRTTLTTLTAKHTEELKKAVGKGRLSVLQNFDDLCKADAFLGFTKEEWEAVRKFFAVNKKISGWDAPTKTDKTTEV